MTILALVALVVVKASKRAQVRRAETFRQAREQESAFFNRKKDEPKNPDDKQP